MIVIAKLLAINEQSNVLEDVWFAFVANFGGSFDNREPKTTAYKLIVFVMFFCGNAIWMGYNASLTVDLSAPSSKLPFNNLETFSTTDWTLYTIASG